MGCMVNEEGHTPASLQHTPASLQHLGPETFLCNGARLTNADGTDGTHFKQPGKREREDV